jgi:hypothetical protein
MSLNPNSSETSFASETSSKISLNINAFNGNTTNFNRCPAPKLKSLPLPVPVPVQPTTKPTFGSLGSNLSHGMIRPM